MAPPDRRGRQRVDEQAPEFATIHLRAGRTGVRRLVEQDRAVAVDHALGVLARADQGEELVVQTGGAKRDLSGLRRDVEQAALRAGRRRSLALVDRRGDTVNLEHPGEGQPTQSGSDDGDGLHAELSGARRHAPALLSAGSGREARSRQGDAHRSEPCCIDVCAMFGGRVDKRSIVFRDIVTLSSASASCRQRLSRSSQSWRGPAQSGVTGARCGRQHRLRGSVATADRRAPVRPVAVRGDRGGVDLVLPRSGPADRLARRG